MKIVQIIHNPKAGNRILSKELLIHLVERAGYECRYSSTKEDHWQNVAADTDFILIAGGDGTVKKVAHYLLLNKIHHIPIFLYPAGTANNIGLTMQLERSITSFTQMIGLHTIRHFDIGKVSLPEEKIPFLESAGWGLFPKLINEMDEYKAQLPVPLENELPVALKKLYKIIERYQPKKAVIETAAQRMEDKYLMIEIMNTPSLGPRLMLAPEASTDDGYFDLMLIPASRRTELLKFMERMIAGIEGSFPIVPLRVQEAVIHWEGKWLHLDDKVIPSPEHPVHVQMAEEKIRFINPLQQYPSQE